MLSSNQGQLYVNINHLLAYADQQDQTRVSCMSAILTNLLHMLINRIKSGLAVNINQLVVVAYVDQQGPTRVSRVLI